MLILLPQKVQFGEPFAKLSKVDDFIPQKG